MAGFNFLFDFALVFIVNSISIFTHISVGAVSNRIGTQHVPYVFRK